MGLGLFLDSSLTLYELKYCIIISFKLGDYLHPRLLRQLGYH